MRALTLLFAAGLGCGSPRASFTVSAVSAGVAVGGAAMAIGTDQGGGGFAILTLGLTVSVVTLVAGAFEEAVQRERAAELRASEQRRQARQRQTQAWALTKQAAEAARRGDCATVQDRDARVARLDRAFHAVVFARDVAIRACLGR
jgi:hypothetical protein